MRTAVSKRPYQPLTKLQMALVVATVLVWFPVGMGDSTWGGSGYCSGPDKVASFIQEKMF